MSKFHSHVIPAGSWRQYLDDQGWINQRQQSANGFKFRLRTGNRNVWIEIWAANVDFNPLVATKCFTVAALKLIGKLLQDISGDSIMIWLSVGHSKDFAIPIFIANVVFSLKREIFFQTVIFLWVGGHAKILSEEQIESKKFLTGISIRTRRCQSGIGAWQSICHSF